MSQDLFFATWYNEVISDTGKMMDMKYNLSSLDKSRHNEGYYEEKISSFDTLEEVADSVKFYRQKNQQQRVFLLNVIPRSHMPNPRHERNEETIDSFLTLYPLLRESPLQGEKDLSNLMRKLTEEEFYRLSILSSTLKSD
ncbi:MAG: hypothetical protein ABIH65_00645 [Nanoarchaeota archaeon]